MFSYEFFEIFKNAFFTEHLWSTASNQKMLLTERDEGILSYRDQQSKVVMAYVIQIARVLLNNVFKYSQDIPTR